jgi:pyruvate dehydrogenase E2 component (dihydrolipoamide acetyltransferase)
MASPITVTMEGTLLNWTKNVGDSVKGGDVIAEIESDKATVEIEAPSDGVLLEQSANVGDALAEGAVIGQIGAAGENGASGNGAASTQAVSGEGEKPAGAPASAPAMVDRDEASAVKTGAAQGGADQPLPVQGNGNGAQRPARTEAAAVEGNGHLPDGVKASPIARRIAEEKGVDLRQVTGSGPGGRIVREDVENFTPSAAPARSAPSAQPSGIAPAPTRKLPAESADVEILDITNMRKRIVAVTVESKQQIPHFYVTTDIDVEALLDFRKQLNSTLPEDAAKISVNDLVVKAAALTLRQFPNLNSHFYGDKIVRHKRINIGIAVALPNGGLMYVVAHDADKVTLSTLAQTNKDKIARAREGKVKPDDISGATFSTSNLGPYDVEHFSAIINPPEAGIIAVGTAMKTPVVKADGTLGVGNRMKATISVDHRVSDGAEGAQYLQAFKQLLENPMRLVI